MKLVLAGVPAAVALLISGCSGPPKETNSVRKAWDNHFKHFGNMDEKLILEDYDAESVIAVYNDFCASPNQKVMEYNGLVEIEGMFKVLFDTLGRNVSNVAVPSFASAVNPIVEPTGEDDTSLPANSNVFLVWASAGQGITYATDSFTFKKGAKVKKQTIVVTEPAGTCVATVEPPAAAAGPITDGWENHFAAFGTKNVSQIMLDYTADSIIRIWDNEKQEFSEHAGLTAIQTMFEGLFQAIRDAAVDGSEGIAVPLVSVTPQYNSVFLVWESFSNPKATDTFIFDDKGIIVRQNIVTKSKAALEVMTVV